MKKTTLTTAIDQVVEFKMKAVDVFLSQFVEVLEDFGNPEKLLGKPYEQWTPEDMARMTQVYGTKEPSPLTNLIFRRAYENLKRLEAEEI